MMMVSIYLTSQAVALYDIMSYINFFITVVTIGFNETVYYVTEDVNGEDNVVEICINRYGALERTITVYLTTRSDTATGKFNN